MFKYLKSIYSISPEVKFFLITELIFGLGVGIWSLNLNFYLKSIGIPTSEIGIINAVGPASTLIFSLAAGFLCDRYQPKRNLVAGCALKTAAFLLMYLSESIPFVYMSRVINGIGDSLVLTCIYPYVTSRVKQEDKNTIYNILYSVTMFSNFLGNVAGGFITDGFLSGIAGGNPYKDVILISACVVGAAALLRCMLHQEPYTQKSGKTSLYIPKGRSVKLYLIFDFFGYAGYFLAYSMLNLIYKNIIGLSDRSTGIVTGAAIIASCTAVTIVPLSAGRLNRAVIGTTVQCVLIILYGIMGFSAGLVFIVLALITNLLSNMLVGVIDSPMFNTIPQEEKGGFSAFRLMITSTGSSLGTIFSGYLLQYTGGYRLLYICVTILIVIQVLIYEFGFKRDVASK